MIPILARKREAHSSARVERLESCRQRLVLAHREGESAAAGGGASEADRREPTTLEALSCKPNGRFKTATIPPGTYTVIGQTVISGVFYSDIVLNVEVVAGQTTPFVTLVLYH